MIAELTTLTCCAMQVRTRPTGLPHKSTARSTRRPTQLRPYTHRIIHLSVELTTATRTPARMTQAIADFENAYTTASNISPPDFTNLGGGSIGGMNLTSGTYKWNSGVNAATDFTLTGSSEDTWVFQVSGVLSLLPGVKAVSLLIQNQL